MGTAISGTTVLDAFASKRINCRFGLFTRKSTSSDLTSLLDFLTGSKCYCSYRRLRFSRVLSSGAVSISVVICVLRQSMEAQKVITVRLELPFEFVFRPV